MDSPPAGDVGRIVATRIGLGGLGGRDLDLRHTKPGARKFMIDVEGKVLEELTRYGGTHTVVTTTCGKISGVEAFPVVGTKRWRMMFDLSDLDGQPADLRAFLQKADTVLARHGSTRLSRKGDGPHIRHQSDRALSWFLALSKFIAAPAFFSFPIRADRNQRLGTVPQRSRR